MRVPQALQLIRKFGTVEVCGGKLKIRFPRGARPALQEALQVLQQGKTEVLTLLTTTKSSRPPNVADSGGVGQNLTPAAPGLNHASDLKGQTVELWRAGERFFVVADDEDARLAMERLGARRGEVWTGAEMEQVARLEDQAARDLIERFKRELDGRVTQVRLDPERNDPK